MATTRLIPLHVNKGKTAAESIKARIDYAQNPEKTEGEYISAYECDPKTAWAEFALARRAYLQTKDQIRERDVIAYQIRQSFAPCEIDPEAANRLGYDLAMRFTKGKHAFTVSTHTDRAHIHNHVIFNAVDLSGTRKFRNFFFSTYALRKLSDLICLEHDLSVVEDHPKREWQNKPQYKKEQSLRDILRFDLEDILDAKPKNLDEILLALSEQGYEIKRGKYLAVRPKKAARFIRLKSLGEGYTEDALIAAVTKKSRIRKERHTEEKPFELMKDIKRIIKEQKGKGYEYWAQDYNVKQAAKVIMFMEENGIATMEQLDELEKKSAARFHELSDEIKACELRLQEIAELKKTIVNYSKTRATYEAYRKAGYSKKFYEKHRAEIIIHQAAKKKFDEFKGKKIPRVKELSAEYDEVLAKKKNVYSEYRSARSEMQKYSVAKQNLKMIYELDSVPVRNAQPSREA